MARKKKNEEAQVLEVMLPAKVKSTRTKKKGAEVKASSNGNGNGNGHGAGRVTNKQRVLKAWEASAQAWPPPCGTKIRLFAPKEMRGRVARIIATDYAKLPKSTRVAPPGKVRVECQSTQFTVAQHQAFPHEMKMKEVLAFT